MKIVSRLEGEALLYSFFLLGGYFEISAFVFEIVLDIFWVANEFCLEIGCVYDNYWL